MTNRRSNLIPYIILLLISAAVYLPFVSRLGLTNDDWYLMYAGKVAGPQVFSTIYEADRPMRAWVLGPAFALFGDTVILYHLSAWLFRSLSAWCVFWLFQMIWQEKRNSNLLIAILFLIYPGFLSQTNAMDYLSQLLALFLATLSIGLTVRAVNVTGWLKAALLTLSTASGIFYLGLVEYFLGFEALRVICLYLMIAPLDGTLLQKVFSTFKRWLPSAIIPTGFVIWRLFFFESQRKATDLSAQFAVIAESPLANGLRLLLALIQDSLSAALFAWVVPFYQIVGDLRLREHMLSLAIAGLLILVIGWLVRDSGESNDSTSIKPHWQTASIYAGMIFVVMSVLPVILVNRRLTFEYYSRYALAAALGSAMIWVGCIFLLTDRRVRAVLISILIFIASLTHFHNGARATSQASAMQNFWWQVSWRVPGFQPGATLVASYPITAIEEDYFVWGPANLIYSRVSTSKEKLKPAIYALVLSQANLLDVLQGNGQEVIVRRGIYTYPNTSNILILSQPTLSSCVHVLDGDVPIPSTFERPEIASALSTSNLALIDLNASGSVPPESIFGGEPKHEWCYYFQRASLASQREEWLEVAELGNMAWKKDLRPADKSEWLVFLDAYARLNQPQNITRLAKDFKKDDYQSFLLCRALKNGAVFADVPVEIQSLLNGLFCGIG